MNVDSGGLTGPGHKPPGAASAPGNPTAKPIRAFAAAETNEEVRRQLARFQSHLAHAGVQAKWVAPEKVHLTLAFIGDMPADMVQRVGDAIDRVAAACRPFEYAVRGTGFFGTAAAPRVVWAGVETGDGLQPLAAGICAALRDLNIRVEDRPFKPHLTIARLRFARGAQLLMTELAKVRDFDFGRVAVDSSVLVKSTLLPAGPVYEVLRRSPLGTGGRAAVP